MIWLTSDTHFNHANILKYCNRPWDDIESHDADLIANWNNTVGPDDDVYHLGDFGFAKPEVLAGILKQLHGRIHHIQGNHDRSMTGPVFKHLIWQKFYYELKVEDDEMETTQKLILCHYPFARWNYQFHGSIHLHGHTHHTLESENLARLDVGVDAAAYFLGTLYSEIEKKKLYRPISYNEIKMIFTIRAMSKTIDK